MAARKQSKMICYVIFFGTLEKSSEHVEPSKQTFGDMFRRMPVTWKEELAGDIIPSSWKNLMSMYKTLCMIELLR
jgi:hypothetical protein